MFISSLVEFLRLPIFSPAKWASLSLLTVAPSSRRARRFGARMGAARMIPGDHARSLCGDFLPAQRPMPSTAIRIENSIAIDSISRYLGQLQSEIRALPPGPFNYGAVLAFLAAFIRAAAFHHHCNMHRRDSANPPYQV